MDVEGLEGRLEGSHWRGELEPKPNVHISQEKNQKHNNKKQKTKTKKERGRNVDVVASKRWRG